MSAPADGGDGRGLPREMTAAQLAEQKAAAREQADVARETKKRERDEAAALLEEEKRKKRLAETVKKLPKAWTCSELLDTDFPEPVWIVPGLMPEGLAIIAGGSKIGKSWMLLGLCHAIATGGFAFGAVPVKPRGVLYLALEDTPRRLKSRLAKQGATHTDRLAVVTEWPRGPAAVEYLEAWMAEHPDTRFIAVDTLARVRQVGSDSNSYDDTYIEAAALKTFADRHTLTLVCATHTRKATVEDFLHGVIGSTGQVGGADTIWRLSRSRGEGRAVLEVTGREVAEQKLALAFDPDVGSWTLTGDATDFQPSDERQEIADLLGAAPTPMSPAEVARRLGRDPDVVRRNMSRMAETGAIVRAAYGKYTPVRGCPTVRLTDFEPSESDSRSESDK